MTGEPADVTALMAAAVDSLVASPVATLLLHAEPGVLVTAETVAWCRRHLRHLTVTDVGGLAGHFLPEDRPEAVADALVSWVGGLRSGSTAGRAMIRSVGETRDYQDWHRRYDDPASSLSWRLGRVRAHLSDALDSRSGPIGVLSVCAGDGRDLLGVLAGRADAERVSAVLLEVHPDLARQAREAAAAAGLSQVDVRTIDASLPAAYRGAAPADVVLLVGIFGNVSDTDVWRLIAFAPQLCRPGATLVWSRGRAFSRELPGVTRGDLNDQVRARFSAAGFDEMAYDSNDDGGRPALGVVRYAGPPVPLDLDQPPLFTFLR